MLKLIRAIKFMSKLEKLKQNEGYEAFGVIITLFSATFVLLFTSHSLGCFFTILMSYEDGENWLSNYSPELVDADVATRYVVALYWAMISIRCALLQPCLILGGLRRVRARASRVMINWRSTVGYGDILPITNSERLFAITMAVIGAIIFSFCVGTISSLISQVRSRRNLPLSRL